MPEPIRFLLNGEELAVAGLSPQTTLLDFLREQRALAERLRALARGDGPGLPRGKEPGTIAVAAEMLARRQRLRADADADPRFAAA